MKKIEKDRNKERKSKRRRERERERVNRMKRTYERGRVKENRENCSFTAYRKTKARPFLKRFMANQIFAVCSGVAGRNFQHEVVILRDHL